MTTQPDTDHQLAEIEARHTAATPGPWGTHRDLNGTYTIQARPRTTTTGMNTDGDIATRTADRTDTESYANARFIAHAPADVAALIAEIRRLRDQLDAIQPADEDTLPAWLYQRFAVIHGIPAWDRIDDGQRAYWEHQAAAVRRAVARGGFKAVEETHVVADDSDDPEHIDDGPGCPVA